MQMKIYPIYHSGFMVELEKHILLFDYYKKDLPITQSEKPLYVFVSHRHQDHYHPDIFEKTKNFSKRKFIFSDDISYIKDVHFMHPDEILHLDDLKISTLQSTDCGVAFIIECEGKRIYHAGDLNCWLWEDFPQDQNEQMMSSFMKEMKKIEGMHFDLAFIPLDFQLSDTHSILGIEIFNQMTDTSVVFPMHYEDAGEEMERRLLLIEHNQNIVNTEKVNDYEF